MDDIEIFFFSGTGNSLHAARELQKRLPCAKLTPLVSLLKKDSIETNAETVGFIFPLHGMTMPIPVKAFLKKLEMKSATYIFALATRGGTKCLAFDKINKILSKKGRALDASFILTMPSNDPKFKVYEVPSSEKLEKVKTALQGKLDDIAATISSKEKSQEEDRDFVGPSGFLFTSLILSGMKFAEKDGAKDYFYADSKCTGCGTCEKVCLSRRIQMVDKKPVWQNKKKCFLCYACLNYCPMKAVQIKTKWYMKSYTDKNGRYPHPFATSSEIQAEKEG